MQYDEIVIGKSYIVTSRENWVAIAESKFTGSDGTEYVKLYDQDGHAGFNYPSQLQELPDEVTDYRSEAARVQGLTAMDARLSGEGIPHSVDDTGGATMIIHVLLSGETYLHIERSEDWDGDESETDGWTIIRFLDSAGETFEDVGFGLTMSEALTAIRHNLQAV